ncbi:hypothetical protein RHSIM_Rhsim05G0116500 [Rhododendron simsii]|uniref:Uncharacterized protein n=1 Tax=Rhododendron simsii TaxID=118357 RepID=A0A834GWN2_RHOSS|nr:hypothetical protein RHSIM_Rhsim05G0116500 [Rhododendron simsii]
MADGTLSMAEGLGLKTMDSNEVRRKQRGFNPQIFTLNPFFLDSSSPSVSIPNRPSPNNPTSKPFDLCPGAPPLLVSSTNPTPSSLTLSDVSACGAYSPKNPSPARKLLEVFQQASNRLESEERISSLLDYACICVEVDAGTDLPDDVQITINGELAEDKWQVVSKGKGKINGNSIPTVADESSSSLSAIEESNGIPSELAEVPNHSDELQLFATSRSVSILAPDIVVKDPMDKGIVVKDPEIHDLSIQEASQPLLSMPTTSRPQQPSVLSPGEEQDSEDELLEVLEGVVSSSKEGKNVLPVKAAVSLDPVIKSAPKAGLSSIESGPNSDTVVNPLYETMQPPKPPDLQRDNFKEKIAELEANKSLSKSAKRRMIKQVKEQSLGSLFGRGH